MKKRAFIGLLFASAGLVAAVACSDAGTGGGGGEDGGASSSGDPPSGAPGLPADIDAYLQTLGERCLTETITAGGVDPLTPESLDAARDAYGRGDGDIALSPSGCTRLLVERRDGKPLNETFVSPPYGVNPDLAKYVARLAVYSYATPGTEVVSIDDDADTVFERHIETEYEKRSVETVKNTAGAVIARSTAVASADGTKLTFTEEAEVDGVLQAVRTFTAKTTQAVCNPPQPAPQPDDPRVAAGPDESVAVRPCNATENAALQGKVKEALVKQTSCLKAAGQREWADRVTKTYVHSALKLDCSDETTGNWVAFNDRGYREMFPGKARLVVKATAFGASKIAELTSTLGHELSHFGGPPHDPALEAAGSLADLSLTDPVYACETACFDPKATLCHLAACAGKTLDSAKARCPGTLPSGLVAEIEKARGAPLAPCTTGHQVGALCRSVNRGSQVQFCTTALECAVKCESPCESKSISCNKNCR